MSKVLEIGKLAIFFLLSQISVYSQSVSIKNYSIGIGLSSSTIYKVFQDSKGYLWVGTATGVDRFDGTNFINFSIDEGLPDPAIIDIFEDSKQRIWFISELGTLSYCQDNKIQLPKLGNRPNKNFLSIAEDKQKVLTISMRADSIIRLDGDRIRAFKIPKQASSYRLFPDSSGRLWGEVYGGLMSLTGDKPSVFLFQSSAYFPRIRAIPWFNDNILFWDWDGLSVFKNGKQRNIGIAYLRADRMIVNSIMVSSTKQLFLGTDDGVLVYDDLTFKYPPRRILRHKQVSTILEDKERGMWFGTLSEGLFYAPSTSFFSFSEEQGLKSTDIVSIEGDSKGNIIVGDRKGNVYKLKGDAFSPISGMYNPSKTVTDILALENGNVVICQSSNFTIVSEKGLMFYAEQVKQAACENGKLVMVHSSQGILSYTISNGRIDKHQQIANHLFKLVAVDIHKDTIYFATKNNVYRYAQGKTESVSLPGFDYRSRITQIKELDSGRLWIATLGAGMYLLHGNELLNISKKNGLESNFCKAFRVSKNRIWVATNKGISCIRLTAKGYVVSGYTSKDGLASDEVNDLYIGENGWVWAATNSGVTRFLPQDQGKYSIAPVQIEEITVNGKNHTGRNLDLSYEENNISFRFAAVTFKHSGNILYKYKLEGLDTGWHTTSANKIQFASVPPGDYVYLVKAADWRSKTESAVTRIAIRIRPPLWQRTWFQLLLGLILVGLVVLLFISWIRKVRRREEKKYETRKKINDLEITALRAQMNPHFLFNSINAIQNYIITQDKKQASIFLSRFASLMNLMIKNTRRNTLPLTEEMKFIGLYLDLEILRFESKIRYCITIAPGINADETYIPSMIIQPFIENAIKHGLLNKSGGGEIKIGFTQEGNFLKCTIEDNGVGRTRAIEIAAQNTDRSTGIGIQTSVERLKLIYPRLNEKQLYHFIDLRDERGESLGSRVELNFQLNI